MGVGVVVRDEPMCRQPVAAPCRQNSAQKRGPPERAQKRLNAGIARVPVTALATALAISLRGRQAIMPLANSNGIQTDFGKLGQFDWFDAESP